MRNIKAILLRELSSYFYSPIAYVVLVLFLLLTGLMFSTSVFQPGGDASLSEMLRERSVPATLIFFLSLLTMRSLSEEFRSGTIETLMTAPVTELEVVLGKFGGVLAFYLVMLAATLVYPIILSIFGSVDLLLLLNHYLLLLLLGIVYLSIGLVFSATTSNQLVAGLLAIVVNLVVTFVMYALGGLITGAGRFAGDLRWALMDMSAYSHYDEMVRGRLSLNGIVFFISSSLLCLFLTVKILESRRWR